MAGVAGDAAHTLLYYTRTVWSRGVQCVVIGAWVTALASGWMATLQARQDSAEPAALTAGLTLRHERFSSAVDPAIDLRFYLKPAAAGARGDRVVDTTRASLLLLGEWFGPFPHESLTVIDGPWSRPPAAAVELPGVAVTSTRWISIERDAAADRALIASLARQYWLGVHSAGEPAWFENALVRFSAARAIDILLQVRQHWSRRYLGGFVPIAIRSQPLSPPRSAGRGRRMRFDELGGDRRDEAAKATLALQTLDRYVGWPALQQGLFTYRERFRGGGGSPAGLLAILNEQGGRDLSWFFDAAFRFDTRFDYGVERLTSTAEGSGHRVAVTLRRFGDGIFAGTSVPRAQTRGRAIPVVIRLSDQTEIREWWDGRDDALELSYLTTAAPESAEVDPDAMLLLDDDRSNNVRRLTPAAMPRAAERVVVNWMLWLQDFMLTCAALT
jgi:hypothetical protein